MKKRVAIWTHGGIGRGFYSQGQPGIQQLVVDLSKEYDLDVYSLLAPNDEFSPATFKIISMDKRIESGWLRWIYLIFTFLARHAVHRYNVLYAFWGYPSGLVVAGLSKLLWCKSILHLQGGDAACVREISYGVLCHPFKKRLCKWAYMNASVLICLTQYQKMMLASAGIVRNVEVIPFGPDLRTFRFTNERFNNDELRLIHIGNYTPVKDQRMLLEAFARIVETRKCILTIIGFDALNGDLQGYAQQLKILHLTKFIEPVPHDQIADHFSDADVIIQSSLHEGQGMVISEAAACGVLLAGTRVGLLSDFGEEYAIIVDVKDAEGLANKLSKLNFEKARNESRIRSARTWAEQHDAVWTYNSINALLKRLVNE